MIRFRCPQCGQKFSVPEKFIGQALVCQSCETKIPVPEQSTIAERTSSQNPPSLPQSVKFVSMSEAGTEQAGSQPDIPVTAQPPVASAPSAPVVLNEQPSSPVPANVSGTTFSHMPPAGSIPVAQPKQAAPALKKPTLTANKAPAINKAPSINPAPAINRVPSVSQAPAIRSAPAINKAPSISPAPSINKAPSISSAPSINKAPAIAQAQPPKMSPPRPQPSAAPQAPAGNSNECTNHPGVTAVEKCKYCGNAICWECKNELNGCCSEPCMHAAVIKAQEAAFKSERKQYAVGEVATKFIKYGVKLIIIVVTLIICWWVWFEFFDPGGKIAWKWEKSFSVDNFHFLTYDKTKINCIAGDKFRSFDTLTGKILTERSEKKLEDCLALLNHSGSRYIFRSSSCVQVIDGEGTVVWRKEFADPVYMSSASEDAVIIETIKTIKAKKWRDPPTYIKTLYALDAKDGKELWSKKLDKNEYMSSITVGKDYYAYISGGYIYGVSKDKQPKTYLKVVKLKDNKLNWRIELKNYFSQLVIIDGMILIKKKDMLHAVNVAEGKKIWSIPVKGLNWGRDLKKQDGMLFFSSGEVFTVVDAKHGRILWSEKVPEDSSTMRFSYGDGRIYFFGTKKIKLPEAEVKQRKLPKAYEDLQKDNPILKQFTESEARKYKFETIITCVNAWTGEKLWVCGNVYGNLILGNNRAVLVRDTAKTGLLGMVSNKGDTVVEQLDLSDGDRMFLRSDPIGIQSPIIVAGDKLIGMISDRGATPGMASLKSRNVTYLGIAAFNLN